MAEPSCRKRWDVHFQGNVQGVGFRYTTRSVASRFAVEGYVKNLPDGRVRLVAEGEPDELGRFIEAIEAALGRYVVRTTRNEGAATGEFEGFAIRF